MAKDKKCWTTKNGAKIRVRDMTDVHLANTIRMIERKAEEGFLVGCVSCDGAYEDPYVEMCHNPSELCEEYEWLLEEADRRGTRTLDGKG